MLTADNFKNKFQNKYIGPILDGSHDWSSTRNTWKQNLAVHREVSLRCRSLCLLVLSHVCCYWVGDLHTSFVLSKILHKFSIRSHKIHDDRVINLETTRGWVQTQIFPWFPSFILCVVLTWRMNNRAGYNSQCSHYLHPSVPDCNKLCRPWKPAPPELLFLSGQSASGKTLKNKCSKKQVHINFKMWVKIGG